jgi:hypothetical protein
VPAAAGGPAAVRERAVLPGIREVVGIFSLSSHSVTIIITVWTAWTTPRGRAR